LNQTKRVSQGQDTGTFQSRGIQYAVTLFFLLMAALLVAYAFKVK
jgi:hypothetical protein